MRRILGDRLERFLDCMRKQNPSCEEKMELRERVREEFPVKRGRNRQFTYEQVQYICGRIVALLNHGTAVAEAEKIMARELNVRPRAIRSVWEHRFETKWRPEE
jgi:hypothetical protein